MRDLAIREAFGGESRDAQLAGGERVAPWLGARGDQLATRTGGDPPRAQVVGEIQRAFRGS